LVPERLEQVADHYAALAVRARAAGARRPCG
jgi:hypothetical protein